MMDWILADIGIMCLYGLQHSLLTTKIAVRLYNKVLPAYTWNLVYSLVSLGTLVIGFKFWRSSGDVLFYLIPGSLRYHLMVLGLALSLFLFFYCFKYTSSFSQWIGIKQVVYAVVGRQMPEYYKVRKEGVKKYIRFPHHTCLIFFFWLHPVMTLDTLLMATGATIYLYLGTYHQDLRGLRLLGQQWEEYRQHTCLLFPGPKTVMRILHDTAFVTAAGSEVANMGGGAIGRQNTGAPTAYSVDGEAR
jgi:methanethiol S-methyltransferase